MEVAALIDKTDHIIIVPIKKLAYRMHSIQCYGERFLEEFLILPSAPGEIELNPGWTWKFIIDSGLYDIDKSFDVIPMYKYQQH